MKAFFLESKKVDVSVDQASLLLFLSLKAFVSFFPVTLPPRQVSTLLNWRLFILPPLLHFPCLGIMVSSGLSPFTDLLLLLCREESCIVNTERTTKPFIGTGKSRTMCTLLLLLLDQEQILSSFYSNVFPILL